MMDLKVKIIVFILISYFCKPNCCIEQSKLLTDDEMLEYLGTTNTSVTYGVVEINIPGRRVKRDIGDLWHLEIPFSNRKTKRLYLKRTDGVLANGETFVWRAYGIPNSNEIIYKKSVLKGLGRFEFYQDYKRKAAVVVFYDLNRIEGFTQYYYFKEMIRIEKSQNSTGPKKYILVPKDKTSNIHTEGIPTRNRFKRDSDNREFPRFDPTPTTVYPQLLIQLDRSKDRGNGLRILMKALIYWNGVDMLYSNLHHPRVKLNIAGFILPMNKFTAPWINKAMSKKSDNFIDAHIGLKELGQYFKNHTHVFPTDEYDFMISFTSKKLDTSGLILGIAYINVPCNDRLLHVALLQNDLSAYITGAHELGHLLSGGHDQLTKQCADNIGIMSSYAWGGAGNFNWSPCIKNSIQEYFKKRKTQCFDNCPRTKPDCGNPPAFKGPDFDCLRDPSDICRKHKKRFSGEFTCDGGILCLEGKAKFLVVGASEEVICKGNDPNQTSACYQGKCVPVHPLTPRCPLSKNES